MRVPDDEQLRLRQRAEASEGLLRYVKRLRWSPERIAQEREQGLRRLLARAARDSPWHRERLRGVDPATFQLEDLRSLPVMTKDAMMDNFDAAVTDPSLTLAEVEGHLAELEEDGYLRERYRVVVTGGTSGRRGVFVYGWEDWIRVFLAQSRWRALGEPVPPAGQIASMYAHVPMHMSSALRAFAEDPGEEVVELPLTLPLGEIVERLNAVQPVLLQSFPTALELLMGEVRAGRLSIAPRQVNTCGEVVFPQVRDHVREHWGTEIRDTWGLTEGVFTGTCAAGSMHLPDDLVIVEPVDAAGEPVAPGELSDTVLLTSMLNETQPLIRYAIGDAIAVATDRCACGSHHSRITRIGGRYDSLFTYPDGTVVHPIILYGPLESDRHVIEFQVHQTPSGIDVALRTSGEADLPRLRDALRSVIGESGLRDPVVSVRTVDALDRLWSGKLRRFVPLAAQPVP